MTKYMGTAEQEDSFRRPDLDNTDPQAFVSEFGSSEHTANKKHGPKAPSGLKVHT